MKPAGKHKDQGWERATSIPALVANPEKPRVRVGKPKFPYYRLLLLFYAGIVSIIGLLPVTGYTSWNTPDRETTGGTYEISSVPEHWKSCADDLCFSNEAIEVHGRRGRSIIRFAVQETPGQGTMGTFGSPGGSIVALRHYRDIEKDQRPGWYGEPRTAAIDGTNLAGQVPGARFAQALDFTKSTSRSTGMEAGGSRQRKSEQTGEEPLDCEKLHQEYLRKFREMFRFYDELNREIHGGYSGSRGDVWGFSGAVIVDGFIAEYCNPEYVSCSKAVLDEYLQCLTECNEKWVHKKPRTAQDRRDRRDERNRCFQEANRKIKECIELHKQPQPVAETPPLETPAIKASPVEIEEDDSLYRDLRWLHGMTKAAAEAMHASAKAKKLMSMQRIAAKQTRMKIDQLQNILDRARAGDQTVFETVLDPFNPVWHDFWDGDPPRANATQAATKALEDKVEELWKIFRDLLKDQDKTISDILPIYDNIIEELRLVGGRSKHEEIRDGAAALRAEIEWERDKDRLELPLAAGRSDKVQALAREYISQSKYVPLARYVQGLDYLEQGKPRLALQTLRLSLETDKNLRDAADIDPKSLLSLNEVDLIKEVIQRSEVAYLESMNSAMMGQAKEVYTKCMTALHRVSESGFYDYDATVPPSAEIEWLQTLKDYFNMGLFSQVLAVRDDTPGGQADLMGEITWEAAVSNGGLLFITRLREKGMTLDEIRNLNNEGLVAALKQHFGENVIEKAKLSPRDLLRMRQTIMAAFQHPDVERLWAGSSFPIDSQKALEALEESYQSGSVSDNEYKRRRAQLEQQLRAHRKGKQQFDLEVDRSYFDVEQADSHFHGGAFEYHWLQYMGDVINLKNTLFMLGPSTAVTVEGNLARHLSSTYTAEQLKSAVTARSIFARLVKLPELAEALCKSPHGERVADALLTLAEPKLTGKIGYLARGTSAAARFTASLLVMMGIVQSNKMVGEAVGGTLDQVLGSEDGTREGQVIGSAIGEFLGSVMVSLGAGDVNMAIEILKDVRVRQEQMRLLTQALRVLCQQADEMAGTSSNYMKQLNQALQEVEAGGLSHGSSKALEGVFGEVDKDFRRLVQQISEGKAGIDQVQQAYRLKALKEVCKALKSGQRPAAKWCRVMLEEIKDDIEARLAQTKDAVEIHEVIEAALAKSGNGKTLQVRPGHAAVADPALQGAQPPVHPGLKDLIEAKLGEDAPIFLKIANRLLIKGEYGKAAQRYEELLTFLTEIGDEGGNLGSQLTRNLRFAQRSVLAYQRLSSADPTAVRNVTERFRPGEVEAIAQRTKGPNATVKLVPMQTKSYSKPFWVYENNAKIGVFKPGVASHSGKDLKAELMYYEIAKRIGYKCPACAPVTMETSSGEQYGVFVRYIDGSDLQQCDAGYLLAARKQIAQDRVLSMLLGDHDRHLRNYMVSDKAGFFSMDHGMADYDDAVAIMVTPGGTTREFMMKRIDFFRKHYGTSAVFMDKFILYDDLQRAVGDLKVIEGELEEILKPVFTDAGELRAVVDRLGERMKLLPEVVEKAYGSVAAKTISQCRRVQFRPLAVLRPCRQWQPVESLRLAA